MNTRSYATQEIIEKFFNRGDVKRFRLAHVKFMKSRRQNPVSYAGFRKRLYNGWNMYKAVHTPQDTNMVRYKKTFKDKWNAFTKGFIQLFK